MQKKKLTASALLNLIPDKLFEDLGKAHGVDYQVKKLYGKRIFQLLIFGLLSQKELSFRILENLFEKPTFRKFAEIPKGMTTDHSSLAERLSYIKPSYFLDLFEKISEIMSVFFPPEKIASFKIIRFDSTLISISSKLLKSRGMKNGMPPRNPNKVPKLEVKFTVGYDGQNMRKAMLFNEPKAMNENFALAEVINAAQIKKDEIAVFDRGITKRTIFESFSKDEIQFVTRVGDSKRKINHKQVGTYTQISEDAPLKTATLLIEKDIEVHLYGMTHRKTKETFRLISTKSISSGKSIYFLTNMTELSPQDITEIYKRRWDIEVLFKFLKQELGLKHFLSRNENGIKVVMFTTLIAAMLIYIYKAANQLESHRIAKLKFINELEMQIMKIIIEMCEGKPDLLDYLDSS